MIGSVSSTNRFYALREPETNISEKNEQLMKVVTHLESEIENGTWAHTDYSSLDAKIIPELIAQANNKYPEMNLKLSTCPADLVREIEKSMQQEVESSRFIVNVGQNGIHFGVIDYRNINGKISLILFEPANLNSLGPAMLAFRMKNIIEKNLLPDCVFSIVEMDIQRSSSECGIFSLALAKKLYGEKDSLTRMHQENIERKFCADGMPLVNHKVDQYLPVSFYKHVQGQGRLHQYLNARPLSAVAEVNKKHETIVQRFNKNLSFADGRERSFSIHMKRISEMKRLLNPEGLEQSRA